MIDIEKNISTFVESQFPDFYKEDGPLFILFAKEYYKWLEENYTFLTLADDTNFSIGDIVTQDIAAGVIEAVETSSIMVKVTSDHFVTNNTKVLSSSGGSSLISSVVSTNPIYYSRNLIRIKDLDFTTDNFLVHFKEKYLKNIQFDTFTAKKTLIKAAQDLYSSKGTERSIDLLFKLVFGEGASVYYPGEDILKPSSGRWVIPRYLEVTVTSRGPELVGKQVYGSASGATAFCEYLIKRNIKGKIIDVLYLSNVDGTFEHNEIIVDDTGIIQDAPKMIGSLSSINITTGGEGFTVGEEVLLISDRGVGAKALVTEIITETGLVKFTIVDGGWGYSNTAEILISEKVLNVANVINSNTLLTSFQRFETISQSIIKVNSNNVTGAPAIGDYVTNPDGANGVIVNTTQTEGATTGNISINIISGNVVSNSVFRSSNQQWLAVQSNTSTTNNFIVGELVYQSNGSANVTSGIVDSVSNAVIVTVNTSTISSNGLHVGHYAYQPHTLATGTVSALPWSSYSSYTNVPFIVLTNVSGAFSNTHSIQFYPQVGNNTLLATATPTNAANGDLIKLSKVSGSRWYPGNTVYGSLSAEQNAPVVVSDVGGLKVSTVDVTATGNVIGSNAISVGVINVNNIFYTVNGNIIIGLSSNTYGNATFVSTGTGANASVFKITNTETVRLALDFLNDTNSTNVVPFKDILLTGANSSVGNTLGGVIIDVTGSGYNNTNIVTFTGGNTGVGSFGAANASIVTGWLLGVSDTTNFNLGNQIIQGTANGIMHSKNTTHLAVKSVLGTFAANATAVTSNSGGSATITTANSGAIVEVILTANVGFKYTTSPTVAVANSTGGTTGIGSGANVIPTFSLGFPKLIGGQISTPLLDILRFQNKTIGTIASLYKINPGENYNASPFISVYEKSVAELGKKDIILFIANTNGAFSQGETVYQTTNTVATKIYANVFTGSASLIVGEYVYSTDGINRVASGDLYSYTTVASNNYNFVIANPTGTFQNTITTSLLTISNTINFNSGNKIIQGTANGIMLTKNTTHIVVQSVLGTFAANATAVTSNSSGSATISAANNTSKAYLIYGDSSNNSFVVANTDVDVSSSTAKGKIKSVNNSIMVVSRTSLFTTFVPAASNNLVGEFSASNCAILAAVIDESSRSAGDNANLVANVVFSDGSLSKTIITDSGFGYVKDEGVTVYSTDYQRSASAKANVSTQGVGTGYYATRDGFLSDTKKLHDGYFYQDYSYQVESPIPLDKYNTMLKEVLHVAGTIMFGKVKTSTIVNANVTVSNSSVTIS